MPQLTASNDGDLLLCRRPGKEIREKVREMRGLLGVVVETPLAKAFAEVVGMLDSVLNYSDSLIDQAKPAPARRPLEDINAATYKPLAGQDAASYTVPMDRNPRLHYQLSDSAAQGLYAAHLAGDCGSEAAMVLDVEDAVDREAWARPFTKAETRALVEGFEPAHAATDC